MTIPLIEIRQFLREKSCRRVRQKFKRSIPTLKKVYGVSIGTLNKVVSKYESGGFELVENLWKSGYFEEKILAAKILGRIARRDPEHALELVKEFIDDITDWAVCDTLAIQGLKSIAKIKQKEILNLSKKLVRSPNPWKRRFGVVLLVNFEKEKGLRKEIRAILNSLQDDREYYVRKAVTWVRRRLGL